MRFYDYLTTLPADAQQALTNHLALGCGHVALAARFHRQDPTTGRMLGTLAVAHTALGAALLALEPEAATDIASPGGTSWGDAPPARWAGLVAGLDPTVLGAGLQIATATARAVVTETAANAELSQVRACLHAAVQAVATMRDYVLRRG